MTNGPHINQRFLKSGSSRIRTEEVQNLLERGEQLHAVAHRGPLRKLYQRICILFDLVADYWKGRYTGISRGAIAVVVFTLGYVVSPLDAVPDFIPLAGLLDDATLVGLCLTAIDSELEKYIRWRETRNRTAQLSGR